MSESRPVMQDSARFAAFDLLRGIAALAIVTRHFPWAGDSPILFARSYLAVDLFFVLSGFVIAHAYGPALAQGMRPGAFLTRRAVRLYPLYLLATLAGAAFWVVAALTQASPTIGAVMAALLPNLLLTPVQAQAGLPALPYPFVGPAWSLFWELLANLALALLYPRIVRALPWLLGIGIVLLALTALLNGSLDAGAYWHDFPGGGGRVVFSFFAGVMLFRMHGRFPATLRVPDWLLALLLLAAFVPPMAMPLGAAYDLAVAALLFPMLVLLGANARSGRVSRRIGHWLGYCSYGVYVLHGPILTVLEPLTLQVTGRPLVAWGFTGAAAFVVVSLACAYAATRWFDGPARRWLMARRGTGATAQAATA
jgi:peptidoglycan/LPS O-acetylase OafA/YrhL